MKKRKFITRIYVKYGLGFGASAIIQNYQIAFFFHKKYDRYA